ncbi:hypothetical protein ACXJJ3_08845 [Kribbella sp. WER1]
MCWIAHDRDEPAGAGHEEHEQVLNELYGLTPAQVHLYDRVTKIVDEALEQFDKGYAVCVEEQTADLARELCP